MKSNSDGLMIYGIVGYIDRNNIDTDQIIPTEYLKSIKKFGFEDYLFDGWRYHDDGRLGVKKEEREINEDFILNIPPFSESKILLARDNFGCGSSREHAVWALRDFGIKAVIASSFGDIFYNNCFKNGVLPIQLQEDQIEELFQTIKDKILELSVDLQKRIITIGDKEVSFDVEDHLIDRIIYGLDDVDITLKSKDKIFNFEKNRKETRPWIFINE
jgi:3-isopropylmalate/(R)-2-methylmalate dehydratase small subunit